MNEDFTLSDHGSVTILTALSSEGADWIDENLPDDVQMWGNGVVIEPRFVEAILDGLMTDGLTVRM